ncbi:FMN-binding split barrel-related protein [Metarhizium album ARSEF 1941]|uniref:FMN-binding split barrel-related protein n=1 Tax=Metarhizium album (strain ARSEF 1941) TaxID=1081103 RepID=A0A0B2X353_METAS|nr:FMN-binding split barrel-related protein [Metarhizium album ARSEF 1941]KHO00183.1 FMN-binding split barrel-related protein [Metarhizium album ARSEF 1941]
MDKIPLNYEASQGDTHKRTTDTIPLEVVQCLENARFVSFHPHRPRRHSEPPLPEAVTEPSSFDLDEQSCVTDTLRLKLHLATCTDNVPHVSLMNYTYLPSSPYSSTPAIIMTTNPASRKTTNIITNPNVSLLVHDWSSHRPPTQGRRMSGGSPGPEHRSSLASLLLNLNSSAVSSISATIGGAARLAPPGSDEEKYFTEQHLANNTFEEGEASFRQDSNTSSDGRRSRFVAGEEVRVIIVDIKDVRISDWKGTVRDWALVPDAGLVSGA